MSPTRSPIPRRLEPACSPRSRRGEPPRAARLWRRDPAPPGRYCVVHQRRPMRRSCIGSLRAAGQVDDVGGTAALGGGIEPRPDLETTRMETQGVSIRWRLDRAGIFQGRDGPGAVIGAAWECRHQLTGNGAACSSPYPAEVRQFAEGFSCQNEHSGLLLTHRHSPMCAIAYLVNHTIPAIAATRKGCKPQGGMAVKAIA
jgi:hypothetical protein